MSYKLILGNKVYSSWSLRAWMLFKPFGIAFEQQVIPLYTDEFTKFREKMFPARQVPTLLVVRDREPVVIWDSLSIAEYLYEQHPEAGIWPEHPTARAAARSLCSEMHSGFMSLRSTMPMNLKRHYSNFTPDQETIVDIKRLSELWNWAKLKWGGDGPYLFGEKFTAADSFFTPVAARFKTYSIDLDHLSKAYSDTLLSHSATRAFYQDAQSEAWVMEHNELNDG